MKHLSHRAALVIALATAATASANNLYWQGGTADLTASNYFDGLTSTPKVAPNSTDTAFIGEDGIANHTTGDLFLGKLVIGHNSGGGGTEGLPGAGTVNVTGGSVNMTLGSSGAANSGLFVGFNASGTLNIDTATVTVNRLVNVAYGLDSSVVGTLNITNGGTFTVTDGNLGIGDTPSGGTGGAGHVSVNGNLTVAGGGADLVIGVQGTSDFTQSGGTVSVNDQTYVGRRNADGSSFTLTGGTFSTGTGFSSADGTEAQGFSDNVAVNLSGGTLNVGNNMQIAVGAARNASLTVSGTADVNITNHLFVGRGTSDQTTFTMTGGTVDTGGYYLMGTGTSGTSPTNIVANHSGGTFTAGSYFILADDGGQSTYNLSGTGAIVAGAEMIVGRQRASATMNQTGGSVTANAGIGVGDAHTSDTSKFGTGTYNVSGGSITVTAPDPTSGDALSIAYLGTGTFHVFGSDATIDINGNMNVYNNPGFLGTLAYTLEAGESLTEINVTGTATFAAGAALGFDFGSTTPSQTSYDLLTAADIIDNGLTFSAPAGWNYQIVSGGNGEILQAFTTPTHFPGDTNNDGVVDLVDLNNVLNNFGASGSNPGDDNSDGVVDLVDLNNVLNNFGATHAASALSVVPEPASLSLLALGATTLLARRRRHA